MIKPLNNYILVDPEPLEEVTAGGILLPEKKNDTPVKGTVLNANNHPYLKDGNKVLYKMWAGEKVIDGDQEYLLIHFNDLIGLVED